MEIYKGKLIAYSLGNFCTPYKVNISGRMGYAPILLVEMSTKGEFRGGRIISATQPQRTGPKLDKSGIVIREIRNLSHLDFPESKLRIADDGSLSIAK
jgi:poly-gamma-glutamate capsule biosynthesis protein CapA/YwtB (metallophosphatase superfamily)